MRNVAIIVFLVELAAAGCLLRTSGPRPVGRILVHSDAIYEIRATTNGDGILVTKLSDGTGAVSPDRHWLIMTRRTSDVAGPDFETPGETILLDLRSGDTRRLFAFEVNGLDWSDDSRRFSFYHQRKLFVSGIDGSTFVVHETAEVRYRGLGFYTTRVFPPTAGRWVAADRLLFHSVKSPPWQITELGGWANPDTPHLLLLSDTGIVSALKVDGMPLVAARCPARGLVLFGEKAEFRQFGPDAVGYEVNEGPLMLARGFTEFGGSGLRSLEFTASRCRFVAADCRLRCENRDSEKGTVEFNDHDSDSLEKMASAKFDVAGRKVISIWDSPDPTVIAVVVVEEGLLRLIAADIQTGRETELLNDENPGFGASDAERVRYAFAKSLGDADLLAWLPDETPPER